MKVKELIKRLKECPQEWVVGISHHDNSIGEVASLVSSISLLEKEELSMVVHGKEIRYPEAYPGKDCVVLHC